MEQNGNRVSKFRTREEQFRSSIKQRGTRVKIFWIRECKKDLKLVHVRLCEALAGLGPSGAEWPQVSVDTTL